MVYSACNASRNEIVVKLNLGKLFLQSINSPIEEITQSLIQKLNFGYSEKSLIIPRLGTFKF